MKNKNIIAPIPLIERPSNEAVKKVSQMSRKDRRKFKKSYAYKKYVKPVLDREKEQKKSAFCKWWWEKGIVIVNILLALIAAATGVIALLR